MGPASLRVAGRRPGQDCGVPDPRAELSSVATALDELVGRLTSIAEAASDGPDDGLAGELF
jgi:hypothetical protein